jgi:hypothetical protein
MGDRRFELRFDADEAAELQWTDAEGGSQISRGVLQEFSLSGMRLLMDRPSLLQASARILVRSLTLQGRIRWCRRYGTEFKVGVELDPECQGVLKPRR